MVRQSRKIQFIILLTLVSLVGIMTIAYAVLSTTLNITGTAINTTTVWRVLNPYFFKGAGYNDTFHGIRPVIKISKIYF